MDIDRFLADNRGTWERLHELTGRAKHLSGEEVRELSRLHQRAAGQLAYAQAHFSDPGVKSSLTSSLAASAAVLYGTRRHTWRTVGRFFSVTFPMAVWDARWFLLVSGVALFLPAVVIGTWIAHSHAALDVTAPPAVRAAYVDHDFASYYSSEPSVAFAGQVYTNNVIVTFEAFAGGITFGLFTLVALVINGANLGDAAGLFYAAHHPGEFWGLVTPHGLLELSSVVLAGGAGLRMGWALISPGDRPRSRALAAEARGSVVLVLGTVLTLAVSGVIEGFVTGSALPTAARVGIGAAVELAFLSWVVLCGRSARRDAYAACAPGNGLTGGPPP
ncbi:MAG: stage II sporulation protein M [Acidimicrobiales bacterium]